MNLTLLATHVAVFLLGMGFGALSNGLARSRIVTALGIVCVPIFSLLTLILLDFSNHAGNGTTGDWYLIYSILTLGIVPIVSLFSAAISGVCALKVQRLFLALRLRVAE
ncbi:MAG: hypothetical protein KDA86_05235 [Planctomycetaceae bacterium]|nr:hypothetical protein [Planctomycetaceae bacterium]